MLQTSIKPRKEIKLDRYPGIYKVLVWDLKQEKYIEPKNGYNGYKFRAVKSIKGTKKQGTFSTFKEAMDWRNGYTKNQAPDSVLLEDVWERYKESVFPTIEKSSVETKLYRSSFIKALGNHKVSEITPTEIDVLVRKAKEKTLKDGCKKRYNFDKELEELTVLFNWYKQNDDYKFSCPVLKRHFNIGKIKDLPNRERKMKPDEFLLFLESLNQNCDPLFYDLAVTQFYTASRIQEMAGLQKPSVDFQQEQLEIKYVVVWDRHRKFSYLKEKPKNGEVRYCNINVTMKGSLLRQYNVSKCSYVFQKDGQPLTYRDIQYNYNKALKKCGLFPKYSSTHIMRHSMASITRKVTGSLDSTQAVTGHKDRRMVEHYAGSPDSRQKQAVTDVETYLNEKIILFKKKEGPLPQIPANAILENKIKVG
ncbi:MAG: tyrosine-type recombinase/integrase [bacterium]